MNNDYENELLKDMRSDRLVAGPADGIVYVKGKHADPKKKAKRKMKQSSQRRNRRLF